MMLSSTRIATTHTTVSSSSRQLLAAGTSRASPGCLQAVKQQQQQHLGSTWQTAAAVPAARQQRALQVQLPRALKDEEAEIDRMTKEAAQSDIWGNELVGNAVKAGIVGAVVAVVVLIANLAQPLYENTIKSFPTPAEYEQYEQREEEGF